MVSSRLPAGGSSATDRYCPPKVEPPVVGVDCETIHVTRSFTRRLTYGSVAVLRGAVSPEGRGPAPHRYAPGRGAAHRPASRLAMVDGHVAGDLRDPDVASLVALANRRDADERRIGDLVGLDHRVQLARVVVAGVIARIGGRVVGLVRRPSRSRPSRPVDLRDRPERRRSAKA